MFVILFDGGIIREPSVIEIDGVRNQRNPPEQVFNGERGNGVEECQITRDTPNGRS